jgi:hypothetical protein
MLCVKRNHGTDEHIEAVPDETEPAERRYIFGTPGAFRAGKIPTSFEGG